MTDLSKKLMNGIVSDVPEPEECPPLPVFKKEETPSARQSQRHENVIEIPEFMRNRSMVEQYVQQRRELEEKVSNTPSQVFKNKLTHAYRKVRLFFFEY